ncbi:hypothetical protein VBD025_13435 [Virgibacillus flavescens]|uniref:hypothetical protein n=1 Tax=Virgibacillus flavescens TaxID=1611422 RepID=UPI003D32671B
MKFKIFIGLLIISILVGCNTNTETLNETDSKAPVQLSSSSLPNQKASNLAKKTLQKHTETTNIYAVNTDKTLLIALEVHHHDRLKLADFRSSVTKKINKQFPDLKTEVSTDKKLVWEIKKLEQKIMNNKIKEKQLKKEMKHLIKLMHKKT